MIYIGQELLRHLVFRSSTASACFIDGQNKSDAHQYTYLQIIYRNNTYRDPRKSDQNSISINVQQ